MEQEKFDNINEAAKWYRTASFWRRTRMWVEGILIICLVLVIFDMYQKFKLMVKANDASRKEWIAIMDNMIFLKRLQNDSITRANDSLKHVTILNTKQIDSLKKLNDSVNQKLYILKLAGKVEY